MMSPNKNSRIALVMTFLWMNTIASDTPAGNLQGGILYPRESESREVKLLDGIWNFRLSLDPLMGFKEKWFTKDLSKVRQKRFFKIRRLVLIFFFFCFLN